jgi:hypothetical protein
MTILILRCAHTNPESFLGLGYTQAIQFLEAPQLMADIPDLSKILASNQPESILVVINTNFPNGVSCQAMEDIPAAKKGIGGSVRINRWLGQKHFATSPFTLAKNLARILDKKYTQLDVDVCFLEERTKRLILIGQRKSLKWTWVKQLDLFAIYQRRGQGLNSKTTSIEVQKLLALNDAYVNQSITFEPPEPGTTSLVLNCTPYPLSYLEAVSRLRLMTEAYSIHVSNELEVSSAVTQLDYFVQDWYQLCRADNRVTGSIFLVGEEDIDFESIREQLNKAGFFSLLNNHRQWKGVVRTVVVTRPF